MKIATLCMLVQDSPSQRVLLGHKKIGFGQGKVVGFGGKIEPGESAETAAVREMYEESSVRVSPDALRYVGELTFGFPYRPAWDHLVYVFLAHHWQGIPTESDEMIPQWYDLPDLPYGRMWQDSAYWLPPVLAGRRVRAWFSFWRDQESVENMEMEIVNGGVESWKPPGADAVWDRRRLSP